MNPLNEKTPTVYAGLDIAKASLQLHLQNVQHVLDNNGQVTEELSQWR